MTITDKELEEWWEAEQDWYNERGKKIRTLITEVRQQRDILEYNNALHERHQNNNLDLIKDLESQVRRQREEIERLQSKLEGKSKPWRVGERAVFL